MQLEPQLIGYRKNGAPIWLIQGGAPEDDNGAQGDDAGQNGDDGTDDQDDDAGDGSGDSGDDAGADGEDGDEPLGPAGTKALQAEKDKRRAATKRARAAEQRNRELQAELDRAKGGKGGKGDDNGDDDESGRDNTDATTKANRRILRSEIKAAAKGVLEDPSDAYRYLDLDEFEVSNDGDVDEDEIADALEKLVQKKPYLAAQGGKRFQGSNNGGPRNATRPKQLTAADLDRMKPADIEKARLEGRLDRLMGVQK